VREKKLQPFIHEHPLFYCQVSVPFICNGCGEGIQDSCYGCEDCHFEFLLHESCVEQLSHEELQYPINSEHPLILHKTPPYDKGTCTCNFCGDPCNGFVYHCPRCKFDIDIKCALLPRTIDAKVHDHPLTLFRKLITFTCDICGKEGKRMPYLCGGICGFVAHLNCTSFPSIVKHIRHKHPLNLTYSLKTTDHSKYRLCQLCVKKVDIKYGIYYCSSCDYVAHLNCATDKEGRDERFMGRESKDKDPVMKDEDLGLDELCYIVKKTEVGEDKVEIPIEIKHFTHEHDLQLTTKLENDKICDGCIRSIYPPFYSCAQCNFFLHKSCAELPRKKRHSLHQHSLTLHLNRVNTFFQCNACGCFTNGFTYRCDLCDFDLDVPCSLLSDMLTHVGHEHPLILSSTTNDEECSACNFKRRIFRCTKCEFTLDFGCATLPHTVGYKQHEHPFTLCYTAEDDSGEYYCDICEEERDPKFWFYYCEECSFPAHPKCIFGEYYWYGEDLRNVKFGSTYTSKVHQHLLTLVHKTKDHPPCDKCGSPCNEMFFECATCNFSFHWRCAGVALGKGEVGDRPKLLKRGFDPKYV
jgi:hypothetical protein